MGPTSRDIVLSHLVAERRSVCALWRMHVWLRRSIDPFYSPRRLSTLAKRLQADGLISPIEESGGQLFAVSIPPLNLSVDALALAQEARYSGILAFATALELHGLTEQRDRSIHVMMGRSPAGEDTRVRPTPGIEVYRDDSDAVRWRLRETSGRVVADSRHAAASYATVMRGLQALHACMSAPAAGEGLVQEVYEHHDRFYWRLGGTSPGTEVDGAEGYATRRAAEVALAHAITLLAAWKEAEGQPISDLIPLGTTLEDWRLFPLPGIVRLSKAEGRPIKEHRIPEGPLFGVDETAIGDRRLRLVTLERALVDGLRQPRFCGGLGEVLRAWVRAVVAPPVRPPDANVLVQCAEAFDIALLYARVGYVMETLGLYHPRLAAWKATHVQRGGSRKLDPEASYAPEYSEAWALSLNHPVGLLEERAASVS